MGTSYEAQIDSEEGGGRICNSILNYQLSLLQNDRKVVNFEGGQKGE
ncbi:hypothetical protein [Ruminococcus bromii]